MTEQQTPASVVERLKTLSVRVAGCGAGWATPAMQEAAALIERLSAEREGLRGALDFAKLQLWRHPVRSDVTLVLSRIDAALTQGESRQTGGVIDERTGHPTSYALPAAPTPAERNGG